MITTGSDSSGSYSSTSYSVGVSCMYKSSPFCQMKPSSSSSSYSGVTLTLSQQYVCCSTNNCNNKAYFTTSYGNAGLPTYSTVTFSVSLRVNLAYLSDYTNLNSAAALTFIQNYKNFVI